MAWRPLAIASTGGNPRSQPVANACTMIATHSLPGSDKCTFVAALDELIAEELSAVGGGKKVTIQNQPRAQPMKRRRRNRPESVNCSGGHPALGEQQQPSPSRSEHRILRPVTSHPDAPANKSKKVKCDTDTSRAPVASPAR